MIVRQGCGGPERHGTLLVCRTKHLRATTLDGLPITTPERTLADLWPRLARYQALQLHRCRSDAEAAAVVTLADAGIPAPQINVRVAGEEADLTWPDRRLIVEIDGGSFHQDKLEDARKTRAWRSAGWHVERIPAGAVYDDPERLIVAARAAPPGS